MPLGDIPMPKIPIPEVHFHGKTEIILGRDWRSVYVEEEEALPEDRPALFAYACVVRGGLRLRDGARRGRRRLAGR